MPHAKTYYWKVCVRPSPKSAASSSCPKCSNFLAKPVCFRLLRRQGAVGSKVLSSLGMERR